MPIMRHFSEKLGFLFIVALITSEFEVFSYNVASNDLPGNYKSCAISALWNNIIKDVDELRINTDHPDWQYLAKRKKKQGLDGTVVNEFQKICDRFDKFQKNNALDIIGDNDSYLGRNITDVLVLYNKFRTLQKKPDPALFHNAWEEFASSCVVNDPNSIKQSVLTFAQNIQKIIVNQTDPEKNFFKLVSQGFTMNALSCNHEQSLKQLLFNVYTDLQLVQLKAYTMIQFSWMLLKLYNKGNFTTEAETMRNSFIERMTEQAVLIKQEMEKADNTFFKCDPHVHIKEETYTEITKFLQGFIVNEVDLNNKQSCADNCAFYKYAKQHGCFQDQFCSKQPVCKGNIVGCSFYDSDMFICQAPRTSLRRYDWIEYENGRVLGQKQSCSRSVTKVDSWWRWLFWHCSYCMCYCDDATDYRSERYFNLRPVSSDKTNNKIVTGIKFVKVLGLVHLQIQEGQLMPQGQINSSTISWKPVEEYIVGDPDVELGKDYHMLTWEHRAMDLDDLKVPEKYVLTGVKLRMVGGHLNLEIEATEMDFALGKLVNSGKKSQWISNDNTDGAYHSPRKQLYMNNPDIPTRSGRKSIPDSKHDQFIEFTSSDMNLDAGQTALPFIDVQPVAPNPAVPLIGAGIYHKGAAYSGGFIGPKVFTYNYEKHIDSLLTEDIYSDIEFKEWNP